MNGNVSFSARPPSQTKQHTHEDEIVESRSEMHHATDLDGPEVFAVDVGEDHVAVDDANARLHPDGTAVALAVGGPVRVGRGARHRVPAHHVAGHQAAVGQEQLREEKTRYLYIALRILR